MLDSILHWLTCEHRDVHRVPPPRSLTMLANRKSAWTNGGIRMLRLIRLDRAVEQELKESSVPTLGPKDATTGLESPDASQDCDHQYTHREGNMWVCFKCGSVTGIKPHGY